MLSRCATVAGLAAGVLADRVFGDPEQYHPVAGFGRTAGWLQERMYADSRRCGVAYCALLVGGTTALGWAAERLCSHPLARFALTATATWAVVGGRSLAVEAAAVHEHLVADDLPAARRRLTHLVGRSTQYLSEEEVVRAVVESVAENTSDAVVAPLCWGLVAGVPGLVGYRAINTLDAMVGHKTPRLARFGWASARVDDVANLPGARVTGLWAMLRAGLVDGSPRAAWRAWRRDSAAHPSPNAGVVEAAFAGALGIRLGGLNTYAWGIEVRPRLGEGREAETRDIPRALRLAGLPAINPAR